MEEEKKQSDTPIYDPIDDLKEAMEAFGIDPKGDDFNEQEMI